MRIKSFVVLALSVALLAGCQTTTTDPSSAAAPKPTATSKLSVSQATARLAPVKARLEPVAERECRARTRGMNCDFYITVDKDVSEPPNAYQTQSKSGRPVITFTTALIGDAKNVDELAFVMGHEAAHHIQGHLNRAKSDAVTGAVLVGVLATTLGIEAADLEQAMEVGAVVGSRAYSKEYELEADRLGTIITHLAGYDPLAGVEYFSRIPDPGNQFLGTHPPNRQRIELVKKTANGL